MNKQGQNGKQLAVNVKIERIDQRSLAVRRVNAVSNSAYRIPAQSGRVPRNPEMMRGKGERY